MSIGGALYPEDGAEVQDLIAVADSALYAAKRAGRNVVRLGLHRTPDSGAAPEAAREAEPSGSAQAVG